MQVEPIASERSPTRRRFAASRPAIVRNGRWGPGSGWDPDQDPWELYYLPDDLSQAKNVANADFIGGWGLWVDEKGRLNHTYSYLGVETYKQTSTKPIPTGKVTVKMVFETDVNKPGSGGTVTLWANDEQIGEGRLDKTIPISPTSYAGMNIGRDNGLVVDLAYEDKAPYAFTGTLEQVTFDLKRRSPTSTRRRCTSTRASTPSPPESRRRFLDWGGGSAAAPAVSCSPDLGDGSSPGIRFAVWHVGVVIRPLG